jgi:cell division septation protein DedD
MDRLLQSWIWSIAMIRKLKSGKYRLYSKKKDPKTGKRKNLGTFNTREEAEKHEKEVQYFKRH